LYRRLGGSQSWSGYSGKEKNSYPLLGLEPSIIQPIAQHYTTANEVNFILYFAGTPKPQRERRTRDRGKNLV
jgi:hypothetical protein